MKDKSSSDKGPAYGNAAGSSPDDQGTQNGSGPEKPDDGTAESAMVDAHTAPMKDSNSEQGYDVTKGTM